MSMDERILFWNKGAERVYGLSPDEVLGLKLRNLICPRDTWAQMDQAHDELLSQGSWAGESRQITRIGRG